MNTLPVFSPEEREETKLLLATKVVSMRGRKLEEGDWSEVYCAAKGIPNQVWSNLHIDVDYHGLGIEFKMLRITHLKNNSIKSVCGTTLMHPAATRSIRINDIGLHENYVMEDILNQYGNLIEERTQRVRNNNPAGTAEMRQGWLLWESSLREFLYFEEPMVKPELDNFYAEWHETAARGIRKGSKSLWIYEKTTNRKRYSVTTSAGIKIQPYFDVPPPSDPNLTYFCVQSEPLGNDTIILWVASRTAEQLSSRLGSTDKDVVSQAVFEAARRDRTTEASYVDNSNEAVPIAIRKDAFDLLLSRWNGVSDDHRVQLLIDSLS